MYVKSTVLLLALIPAVSVGAGEEPSSEMGAPAEVPDGHILVREDVWVAFEDQPTQFFHRAREDFFKNDVKAAAAEVRMAVAFLRIESGRATPEGKKALTASVDELRKLADDLEKRAVSSASTLDYAFAQANYALAKHHQLMAEKAWAMQRPADTGGYLSSAAKYLERGAAWAGGGLKSGTAALLPRIKDLGIKLRDGTGWAAGEVGRGIQALGGEVEVLGSRLKER